MKKSVDKRGNRVYNNQVCSAPHQNVIGNIPRKIVTVAIQKRFFISKLSTVHTDRLKIGRAHV